MILTINVKENICYYCGDEFSIRKPNEQRAKCRSAAEVKIENAAGGPMLYVWTIKEALTGDTFSANFELTGPH